MKDLQVRRIPVAGPPFFASLFKFGKVKGIGFRLGLAMALLSCTTLLLAGFSSVTFSRLEYGLVELKEQDIPALEKAAQLNDKVRIVIGTSSQLVEAESNLERDRALLRIEAAIEQMDAIMVEFPDYHAYFKDLIAQVSNSLSLLYQSEVDSERLDKELRALLEGFYPLLQEASLSLDDLSENEKFAIEYSQLKALLYYQLGLVEKIYNDASFNELDYTSYRLEQVGEQWWTLWQSGHLEHKYPSLNKQLMVIHKLASHSSRLYQLKNQALDHYYQQQFLLQNSREHLNQLSIQMETNTARVNSEIDRSIHQAQQSLVSNQRISLALSLFSLLAAALISWFYVQKNILQRLGQLKTSMFALSTGHLDTHIEIKGGDEVTQMAKCLRVFQATAKAVKRTNYQLQEEVEERRSAEEKLRVTQDELVQAGKLAALGQLTVGITHEINQPLSAVNSHVHSARRWLENKQVDKAQLNLNKMEVLLGKVAAITHHLKSFSRKSDGRLTDIPIVTVVQDAVELFENQPVPITLSVNVEPSQRVWGNQIRLEQVLVNLISNALDAVENVIEPTISVTINGEQGRTLVAVKDNGVGIHQEDIPSIFDPFYTSKAVGKGTGLGLSIAYNIIKDFGGSIHLESKVAHGSEFVVNLKQGKHHG